MFGDFRVEVRELAPLPVQCAAVFLGDVLEVDVGFQGGFGVGGGEDEDLRDRDGVEPALQPGPDCREEGGRAYDL